MASCGPCDAATSGKGLVCSCTRRASHLFLSKKRDRLPHLPQHLPDFEIICGHHSGLHLPLQLKLLDLCFVDVHLPPDGLRHTIGDESIMMISRGSTRNLMTYLWQLIHDSVIHLDSEMRYFGSKVCSLFVRPVGIPTFGENTVGTQ